MRAAFSDTLVAAAKANPKVLLLTGDHGYALFDPFRKACPDQYINCGIAEQNMIGVAAGLAKAGFRPIVYGLAAFVPIRVLEQIKIDLCYEGLPVMIAGDGAGVVYAQLGTSHQSTEDIAALRALPGIEIYSPADRHELVACMQSALRASGPSYLRMGKADLGDVHTANTFALDIKAVQAIGDPNSDTLLIATGSGVSIALAAAQRIGGAQVLSIPCIKPLDQASVMRYSMGKRAIVVIEEHNIAGGLGSLIAETLIGHFKGQFLRIGVKDRFTSHCGGYPYVMREHGLDLDTVVTAIQSALTPGSPA